LSEYYEVKQHLINFDAQFTDFMGFDRRCISKLQTVNSISLGSVSDSYRISRRNIVVKLLFVCSWGQVVQTAKAHHTLHSASAFSQGVGGRQLHM